MSGPPLDAGSVEVSTGNTSCILGPAGHAPDLPGLMQGVEPCQVRPSGPGRGNGAFAVRDIDEGVCLGDYEGELINEETYWTRYPSGVVREVQPQHQFLLLVVRCGRSVVMIMMLIMMLHACHHWANSLEQEVTHDHRHACSQISALASTESGRWTLVSA